MMYSWMRHTCIYQKRDEVDKYNISIKSEPVTLVCDKSIKDVLIRGTDGEVTRRETLYLIRHEPGVIQKGDYIDGVLIEFTEDEIGLDGEYYYTVVRV